MESVTINSNRINHAQRFHLQSEVLFKEQGCQFSDDNIQCASCLLLVF